MQTLELPTCFVLDPEIKSAPVVVVSGGLYSLEGKWLRHQIPLNLQRDVIFVLPKHYTNDCARCLKELNSKIGEDKIDSYSLCGFSRGGINVYAYWMLKAWKILGLIDPSAPRMGGYIDPVLDSAKDKIRCVYNLANWRKASYFAKIQSFHQHLLDIDAEMTDTDAAHNQMPKFFFDTYGSDLTN
jgi:hypothetical protein